MRERAARRRRVRSSSLWCHVYNRPSMPTSASDDALAARLTLRALVAAVPDDPAEFDRTVRTFDASASSWRGLIDESIAQGVLGIIARRLLEFPLPPDVRQEIERRIVVE